MFAPWHKHRWTTVAIDTSNGWTTTDRITRKTDEYQHIIEFQHCQCGARRIDAVDALEAGRNFALNKHSDVALQAAIWIASGNITKYHATHITWIDPAFAPLGGFEKYLVAMKKDPELKKLLKEHSMVDDALGQFEVAVKLHMNNQATTP